MKIAVWDTYVKRSDGKIMHFDILVDDSLKDEHKIFAFGEDYLTNKPFEVGKLSFSECKFCHIEKASEEVSNQIKTNGYSIIEMENCD